jgi:probable rRNA maturation factor
MSAGDISVLVEDTGWKKSGVSLARVKTAARLALARGNKSLFLSGTCTAERSGPIVTLLLASDERLRSLNARFRRKDVPTNVLSFPAAKADRHVGDVAIALGVATREATTAGKELEAHVLHLVVHGVLHLFGYDHVRSREARVMERLEIAILDELGIPSPYAPAAAR